MTDQPDEPTPEAIKLPPEWDSCLIGADIARSLFAYSVRKLVRFEMMRASCKASEARKFIAEEFIIPLAREHGENSPCFIDDELLDPISDEEKPLIILPKDFKK